MRYKTRELSGRLLDEAVAKAEGYNVRQGRSARWCEDDGQLVGYIDDRFEPAFRPSRSWWDSLPILLRRWRRVFARFNLREALLRAHVLDILGDEVEL